MQKWLDLLTPSAAAIAILIAIALAFQATRQGKAIKRLEERIAEREGAGARVALDRIRSLQRRTSSGDGRRLAPVAAAVAALAVAGGTVWYVALRDSGSNEATQTVTGAGGTRTTPTPIGEIRTTAKPNPDPLTPNKGAFTVLVLNGTFTAGAAGNGVLPIVQQAGYATATPDNATKRDFKESVVVYLPGRENVADNVAKDLGIAKLMPLDGIDIQQSTSSVDAVVIVGQDLADRYRP